ncbi:hypothetical protein GCM10028827_26550 [Mucilaginibacter myungsuensis]
MVVRKSTFVLYFLGIVGLSLSNKDLAMPSFSYKDKLNESSVEKSSAKYQHVGILINLGRPKHAL